MSETTPAPVSAEQIAKAVNDTLTPQIDAKLAGLASKDEVKKLSDDFATLKAEIKVGEPRVKDDPKLGFKHEGEFFALVKDYAIRPHIAEKDERLALLTKAPSGMSVLSPSDGGYAVIPPAFSTAIWDGLNKEVDSLISMCDQYNIEGESMEFLANSETSRASGSRYGGVNAYWTAEAVAATASAPTFRKLKLEPQEITALAYVTDKLLEKSAVALGQYVSKAITEEMNWLINNAILRGTGAGQPLGILNAGCTVSVSKESSQTAATIKGTNILKMFARLHPRCRKNAVWLYNVDCEPQLNSLSLITIGDSGTASTGYFFRQPGTVGDSPYGTLMGRPAIPVEYCSTLGTVGDIVLADLGMYAVGLSGSVKTASSIHVKFTTHETAFRFRTAVDGQPWLASALTPANGSNTLSPFISLATRS